MRVAHVRRHDVVLLSTVDEADGARRSRADRKVVLTDSTPKLKRFFLTEIAEKSFGAARLWSIFQPAFCFIPGIEVQHAGYTVPPGAITGRLVSAMPADCFSTITPC